MKNIILCIMLPMAFPFMLLGMLMTIAKAGFETGEEWVTQLARKYL
jgi:ABC-type phosphate transport system permease subunit